MSPANKTHTLRTQGLGIRFGEFQAVSDVNLSLEPGARQALIGPNGAGKTTLINLLTGVFKPTSGSIHMGDHDLTRLSADKRARMGLSRTFQINTLFPSLTPLLSVVLAISEREGLGATWWRPLKGCTKVFDEAHSLLGIFRLDSLADVPVAELAYGKQRLLEIALALAAKPRILLLDEPAAGVPQDESGELFEVIAALPQDISVLFIEHDMKLVFRFSRRISVLVGGRILTEGTPSEIGADPRVREVYLGSSHHHA
ncbi:MULTISPECIES: ABC transporter ATP-binding protein [Variovorax]|jgi:branched-chain amino acid transport system ATP-binding protein|uniref:ABC transporter ATP-binding protein n=1 Tax=Variovorax TaxID=34072 RepID=UPI00086BDD03|nr:MULTISPECIES: ABC transporter ATP-binding protein [Variovorax]MBN8757354.1 ABC transporter ATP-binding protein [Variovorax sp.]ODU15841.1 MAG: branched-chain amino acid ABC transporter ATP-binding protein [Variovorax sp. SCN 67-85]ODV21400.1 MAG: branched-chain amino acid ABC transporter ATP-binding protein [Variovorax sp. SCN 67-20]OJZ14033.1 MAG: branched-chain amino acid ABC transporter ATP-binding protein [Variovorax sp. 67-131]UKI08583.1 ABC transporter ATP-binding protein [Variovorax 